jgi:hypothetical protein
VPGPLAGKSIGGLTCSAYSAARGGQEFKLCRSNFIDGGFLDNAPVGLAVEQAEAFSSPRTLRPLTVLLVDPSIRRPRESLRLRRREPSRDSATRCRWAMIS